MRKILRSAEFYVLTILIGYAIFIALTFPTNANPSPEIVSVSTITNLPSDDTAYGGAFFRPSDHINNPIFQKQYDSLNNLKTRIDYKNDRLLASSFFGCLGAAEDIPEEDHQLLDETQSRIRKLIVDSLDRLTVMIGEANGKSRDSLQKIQDAYQKKSIEDLNSSEIQSREQLPRLYYIGLRGYKLKEKESKFFIDNNSYNIAYIKYDSVRRGKYGSSTVAHYERTQIPVRYATRSEDVLIPISERQHAILNPILLGSGILFVIASIMIFAFGSVVVLFNISKGKPFALKNILYLKLMAYTAIIIASLKIFSSYLLHQIYSDLIPGDLVLPGFLDTLRNSWKAIFTAVALYLLMKAFTKGNKLQQDNSLTI